MADETLKLEIVTPDATIFSGQAEAVTLPGLCGEMQVLPGHVPLMTQVVPGRVLIRQNGEEKHLVIGEGFARVTCTHVSILTDLALQGDDVDAVRNEEARRLAKARFAKTVSDEESATVSAAVAHAISQIRRKNPRHH